MEVLIGKIVRITEPARSYVKQEFINFEGFGVLTNIDLNRKDPFEVYFIDDTGNVLRGNFDGKSIDVIR